MQNKEPEPEQGARQARRFGVAALLLPFPFIALSFAVGDRSVVVYSILAAELTGLLAIIIGRAGLRSVTRASGAPDNRGAAVSRLMSGRGIRTASPGSVTKSRESSEAKTGIVLGTAGMAAWGIVLVVLAATAGSGGPGRAEPTTPQQLAVAQRIGALFSALAANDAARACEQLTPGARTAGTPVLHGTLGWLRCRDKPVYRWDPSHGSEPNGKVYNVKVTGTLAEAEVPFGSDRYSNGWSFRLTRVGGRWLIAGASVYTYVGG